MKTYNLTPEFFARTRTRLVLRKAELEQRKAELVEILNEMQAIDEQINGIDADEKLAAEVAARYPDDSAPELPKKRRGSPGRPTPSRPVPSGRPWTPEEDAAVMAGDPANDEALAKQLDRKGPDNIAVRRRKIRRARHIVEGENEHLPERAAVGDPEPKPSQAAEGEPLTEAGSSSETNARQSHTLRIGGAHGTEAHPSDIPGSLHRESGGSPEQQIDKALFEPLKALDEELDRLEPSRSENTEIYEPTRAPQLADNYRRLLRTTPPKPGRDVTGMIVDNGPLDQRVYDPIAHASREPR